jgi:hypothetical protein
MLHRHTGQQAGHFTDDYYFVLVMGCETNFDNVPLSLLSGIGGHCRNSLSQKTEMEHEAENI